MLPLLSLTVTVHLVSSTCASLPYPCGDQRSPILPEDAPLATKSIPQSTQPLDLRTSAATIGQPMDLSTQGCKRDVAYLSSPGEDEPLDLSFRVEPVNLSVRSSAVAENSSIHSSCTESWEAYNLSAEEADGIHRDVLSNVQVTDKSLDPGDDLSAERPLISGDHGTPAINSPPTPVAGVGKTSEHFAERCSSEVVREKIKQVEKQVGTPVTRQGNLNGY